MDGFIFKSHSSLPSFWIDFKLLVMIVTEWLFNKKFIQSSDQLFCNNKNCFKKKLYFLCIL